MKLYLISRDGYTDYDQFDSAVVCAESEQDARMTHPWDFIKDWDGVAGDDYPTWVNASEVVVKEVGLAHPKTERGVICASFNAS